MNMKALQFVGVIKPKVFLFQLLCGGGSGRSGNLLFFIHLQREWTDPQLSIMIIYNSAWSISINWGYDFQVKI